VIIRDVCLDDIVLVLSLLSLDKPNKDIFSTPDLLDNMPSDGWHGWGWEMGGGLSKGRISEIVLCYSRCIQIGRGRI